MAGVVAKLTMYAIPVLKRLMDDTMPLMFAGAREYAMPYAFQPVSLLLLTRTFVFLTRKITYQEH
jgi:hypothetical protein